MITPVQVRKPVPGRSLADMSPEVAAQWDENRNSGLTPADVSAGSSLKVWWRCAIAEDHRWLATIADRSAGKGCPFCRGLRASRTNSLAVLFPALAEQLHPTRNGVLRPEDVVAGSARRLWWKCPVAADHEWQAVPHNRKKRPGCPFCSGLRSSTTHNLAAANPALVALWHPSRNGTLTAADVTPASNKIVWWKCPVGADHEWRALVTKQRRGKCPFCRNARASVTNSLAATYPRIARLWDRSRNRSLAPSEVVPGSKRAIWWRCTRGPDHAWRAPVSETASSKGCPFCSNRRVSVTNCLATVAPAIARRLHPTKNGKLAARDIVATSKRPVWWRCNKDPRHVWKGPVQKRVQNGRWICVMCTNRRLSPSNSLARRHPKLAAEWDAGKNGKLTPAAVTVGFHGRVWWKCLAAPDHEWQAPVHHRVRRSSCPFCVHRLVAVSDSLARTHPYVARLWHPEKNAALRPTNVVRGSERLAWWLCPQAPDHEWQMRVLDVVRSDGRCPFCIGRRVSVTNSLATMFPKVAREWSPRNRDLAPADVLATSNDLAWWHCPLGHDWRASVRDRTARGRSCPACTEGILAARRVPSVART